MIDRVVHDLHRRLLEVPVGFKWFAQGLFEGTVCFGGEESAGRHVAQRDGRPWTTDKDGPVMDLLAAEILARTGKDPGEHYQELTARFGTSYYTSDRCAGNRSGESGAEQSVARLGEGHRISRRTDRRQTDTSPGNDAPIGGLKVVTANGWFAARPSGTENIYKIYAESFKDPGHLDAIVAQAQTIVRQALAAGAM